MTTPWLSNPEGAVSDWVSDVDFFLALAVRPRRSDADRQYVEGGLPEVSRLVKEMVVRVMVEE